MRDLEDYQQKYKTEPGEALQVKYRRKHILSIMGKYPHKNILEIGCGMEPLFLFTSDYDTMTVVEPGDQFVKNAKELALKQINSKSIRIIEGFFEKSSDELNKIVHGFDYIVASSLLHELENPDNLMYALYKVAEVDTVIHINVPNANSLHKLIAKGMGLINDTHELSEQQKIMQRKRVYDINNLCEYVETKGFTVIDKGSFVPKIMTGAQMDAVLAAGIIDESYYDGLDSIIEYIPQLGSEIYVQLKRL